MEYAAMLSAPDLVSGLRDLLADPDPRVVKRTVRVFANVYRHALQLLATGELDEATFKGAWPAVKSVAEQLMALLAAGENEGIIIHIIRFLEAALVAHLLSDVSRYPDVAAQSPEMVDQGVAALKGLITTPYVGGSAFIVAIRALITVACYKPDLWQPVTELIEQQIASPPPTLFDHNVRTLHKMLQRNLFRLLRRTESMSLRGRLIEMMVTVGVPRRMLSHWAPPQESRKRPAQVTASEDDITGRNTPPSKRPREDDLADAATEDQPTSPSDFRDSREPRESRDPREHRASKESRDPRENREPRPGRDPRTQKAARPPRDPRLALEAQSTPPQEAEQEGARTPPASGRSTPESKKSEKSDVSSHFEFLKSLITSNSGKNSPAPFAERCSPKERAVYDRLEHPQVVELVLSCLGNVPDSPPEDLVLRLQGLSNDVQGMRERLATLLAPIMPDTIMAPSAGGHPIEEANASRPSSASSGSSYKALSSSRASPPTRQREPSPPSPPSSPPSNRSTPSDASQDVDMRQLLGHGFGSGDVDMRSEARARPSRDPREGRKQQMQQPPAVNVPRSSIIDPRITSGLGFGSGGLGRQDPRSMSGPAGMSGPVGMNGPMVMGGPIDPRGSQVGGGGLGGPSLFGPGPGSGLHQLGGLRAPWQNGNMQANSLAMMMHSINAAQAIFPQAPPMHL